MSYKKIVCIVCILIGLLAINTESYGQTQTFPSGSAIIDMGAATPTIKNSLKPYGLVYALLKYHNVPVNCVINQSKVKDGIDFTYNGKSYSGGTFVVSSDFFSSAVSSLLTSWAKQGVLIDYTNSDLTVNVTYKLNFVPKWVMDKTNGNIGVNFLNNAGIPSSAFSFKNPTQLGDCDDIFILPHADPTWANHNNLYFWNRTQRGAIWAGCHAVSVLENTSKDTVISGVPTTLRMNFLSTAGLVPFTNHANGTVPFASLNPTDPMAQYIGKTDNAQLAGSETVFLPASGSAWRTGTKILTSSPVQSDIPALSAGPAAVNIYGRGFDEATSGYVAYQGAHNIASSSSADNIAAQRLFFNFSFFALNDKINSKISASISGVPAQMTALAAANLTSTVTGDGGPFTYQWKASVAGTFLPSATAANPTFTPSAITNATTVVFSLVVTDANCSRVSFDQKKTTIIPANPPLTVNAISKSMSGDCSANNSITFNVFDSNVEPNAGARTLVSVTGLANGTVVTSTSGSVTYTPSANFLGTDAGTYTISNGTTTANANISITVGQASLIPVLTDDAVTAIVDNVTVVNVIGNDLNNPSASNGNKLYVRDITVKPTKGYVYLNVDGTLSYLSTKDPSSVTGGDTFKYLACNDAGYCSVGTVTVTMVQDACAAGQYQLTTTGTTSSATFTPTADSYIQSSAASTNFGSTTTFLLNGVGSAIRKPLLMFDLSTISATATVNSSFLSLTTSASFTPTATANPFPATVFGVTKSWTELDVTYAAASSVLSWTTSGLGTSDYTDLSPSNPVFASPALSVSVPSGTVLGSGDLKGIVQGWVTTPANNKGFLINPATSTLSLSVNFHSRTASSSANHPRLAVNYTTPAPCFTIPTNYKPIAYPDTTRTKSNTAISINVKANDLNFYGNTNSVTAVTIPANGTASIDGSNNVLYTPNGSFVGTDTLTYTITDGTNGQTTTATVRIVVTRVAPSINRDIVSTNSNTAITIGVTSNDSDPQGGTLSAPTITTMSKNGSATVSGNNIIYTPSNRFTGKDTLIYQRSLVTTDACTTVLSDTAIVYITITNQPPVAVNDAITTFSCTPVDIKVKTNDSDPEQTTLTPILVSNPANGTVVLNGEGYKYTPNTNFTGTDQFTYKVQDGSTDALQSNTATVVITVSVAANPNRSPLASADNDNTLINQPLNTNVLANDSDPDNDPLTINITATGLLKPANGTIQLLANNMIRYTPNEGFTGTDTYEYQICDTHPSCAGSSTLCAKALVTVKISAVPIQVGGNIWDDADGSAAGTFSNIKNGAETGTNADGAVYVYLVDSNNEIIDQTSVDNGGAYLLVNVPANTANLKIILSDKILSIGETLSAGTLPGGYTNTSPITKTFTTGTTSITNSDFGIGQLPVATSYTFPIQLNPGALVTLDATKFTGTDPDGTVVSVKYTSFPTNASVIEIGGVSYTAGSFPAGGVTVALNTAVKIFPNAGSVSPVISFVVIDNSGNLSPITATVTVPFYVPLAAGTISGNVSFCGTGIPSTFTSTADASGGQAAIAYQWQMSSVVGFGTLTDISGATAATYTPSSAITTTTYFRRKASTSGDAAVFSNILTVTINPLPASPTGSPAVSLVAAAVAISATANGATGDETVDWYAAPTGGTALINGVSGNLTTVYTTPIINNTTAYYAVARNVNTGCMAVSRTVVSATISGTLYPGIIGSDQNGCGTFTPTGLSSVNDASGLAGITYQWQSSTTSATAGFNNIPGATAATYSPGAVATTTYYRRVATSGTSINSNTVTVTSNAIPAVATGAALNGSRTGAGTVTLTGTVPAGVIYDWYSNATATILLLTGSNSYTTPSISQTTTYYPVARNITTGCTSATASAVATINPVLSGGIISSVTSSICGSGTPGALNSTTAATGGTGTYNYQWQSSTTSSVSGFTDIAGATAATYTPSSAISVTTYYRRAVSTATDAVVYSNVVAVTVVSLPNVKISPSTATISVGNSQTLTASGADTYVWTPATNLSATTLATISASPSVTTTYTVTGTNASTSCANTATITVTVVPALTAGTIAADQAICSGIIPAAFTSATAATGGVGTYNYQWQSSTTSTTAGFTDITGATAATYTPGAALTVTTYYRRGVSTSSDAIVYSNVVTVTVSALPTVSVSPTTATIVSGASQVLTASGANSYIWSPATGLSSTTLAAVTASPVTTTVYTVTGTNTTTSCANTATITVTVAPVLTAGTIAADQAICSGATPAAFTSATAAAGGIGTYAYQWQSSTTSTTAGFTDIAGATAATYAPGTSLTTTTYYRRGVSTSSSAVVYSNVVTVTVSALPTVSVSPATATIVSGASQVLTASGANSYVWSPATGLSSTTQATITASPVATTIYTVTGTNTITGCVNTATVTVTVNAPNSSFTAGAIAADQVICSGSVPNAFTSTIAASGGTGTINYQWQRSTDNINFTDIAGATAASYTPGATTQLTYFRRGASTSVNTVLYTSSVKVTPLTPPVISGGINGICAVSKDSLRTYSVTPAVGATSYVWTLPNGWTGTSTTNTITAKVGTLGGTISVTPFNGSCAGNTVNFTAYVIDFVKVDITGLPVTALGNNNSPIAVTIKLFDANGVAIPCSGGPATLSVCNPSGGTFTTVIDNNNGTYSSSLTAFANSVDVCGTIGGVPIQKTLKLTFTGPQGGIKGNGPILATEIPKLTFTMTEGRSPYTIVYKSAKSNKNDTLTNYISGTATNVALIPSTTLYTLVSITDANGEKRVNNFNRDTATIIVLAPKVIITLKADPAKQEKDSSWATRIVVNTKNIGDLDLSNSQARLNLRDVFPNPVTYVLDSVRVSGATVVPNRNYDGVNSQDLFAKRNSTKKIVYPLQSADTDLLGIPGIATMASPDGSAGMEFWRTPENNQTTAANEDITVIDDGHSVYMFGPLSTLPVNASADIILWLHVKPNGYAEPFVMQAIALGTGKTAEGTALATSLSNDNTDVSAHPEVTKQGEPLPTVINLFPSAVIGVSLAAGAPVAQGNGTYNVTLSYKLKNYGNLNLNNLKLFQNLGRMIGSPAVFSLVSPVVTTGTLLPNPGFNAKTDSNMLAANSVLGYKQEATLQFTINITPNQLNAIYQLQATVTAFSNELNTTITDLSTDGLDPDPDANAQPTEKIITEILINRALPTLVPGNIGIKTGPAVTVLTKGYCGSATRVEIIPTSLNTGGLDPYQYQWQESSNNTSFTDIPGAEDSTYTTGTVTSSVYLRRGTISGSQVKYSNAVYVQIYTLPAKPVITGTGTQVVGKGNITLTSSPAAAYSWSTAAVTRNILVTDSGSYKVTITDANGCTAVSDNYIVTALDPYKVADITKTLSKAPVVQEDGSFLLSFNIVATNLRGELLDTIKIKDDLSKVFPASTSFSVVDIKASGKLIANGGYDGKAQIDLLNDVSKLDGLKADSVQITIKLFPNGFAGTLNNVAILTARSPYGVFSVSSNDPIANGNPLIRMATKFVIPLIDIFIPSGFSPNKDGTNDLFVITRPFNTTISLDIFNRWGNQVYKSTDYKNTWDGKGNQPNRIMGDDLPDGTYYYVVLATDRSTGSIRKFAGFITLKR